MFSGEARWLRPTLPTALGTLSGGISKVGAGSEAGLGWEWGGLWTSGPELNLLIVLGRAWNNRLLSQMNIM